ncbi:hypothetical protein EV359DRAFT_79478 [Lentinula novae-zelandiae]|nr:hypothetical protein EV359DRAFT_79478 [Lentinula novae-zelandiae]
MFLRRSSPFCRIFFLYIVFAALLGVSLVTSRPLVAVPHLLERSGGDQPKIPRPRQEMKQRFLTTAALIRSFTEPFKDGDLVIRLGCRKPGQEEGYMVARVRIMSLLEKDLKFTIFFGTIVGFSASTVTVAGDSHSQKVIVEQSDIPRSDVSETMQNHRTPRIDQSRLIGLGLGRESLVAHFYRNDAAKKQLVDMFGDADNLLSHTQAMFRKEYGFSWAHMLVINDDLDYITVAMICMQMIKGPKGQVLAQGVLGEWLKIYLAMKALRGSDSIQHVMAVEWLLEGKYTM